MGVGGDEGGVGDVGPAPESQSTASESGEGEGDADWVEGFGEGCESAKPQMGIHKTQTRQSMA